MSAAAPACRPCAVALFAALVCGAAGAGAQELLTGTGRQAPAAMLRMQTFGDWLAECERSGGERNCRISTAAATTGAAPALRLTSGAADPAGRVFVLLTPLDLLLPRGIEMRIDGGSPLRLAYRSCHAQGCVVPFRADAGLERRLRPGARLGIRLFDLQGNAADVELSLIGYIAAADAAASEVR